MVRRALRQLALCAPGPKVLYASGCSDGQALRRGPTARRRSTVPGHDRRPQGAQVTARSAPHGGVAEWLIAAVLKTAEGSRLPGVQIPPPPPEKRPIRSRQVPKCLAGFVFLLPIVPSIPIRTLSISAHGWYSGWYRPRVPPFHARLYHPMESL